MSYMFGQQYTQAMAQVNQLKAGGFQLSVKGNYKEKLREAMSNAEDIQFGVTSHYNQYEGFEVIDVCEQLRSKDGTGNFNRGNAFKYLARAGWKGGPEKELEDLEKAKNYIQREIDRLTKALEARVKTDTELAPLVDYAVKDADAVLAMYKDNDEEKSTVSWERPCARCWRTGTNKRVLSFNRFVCEDEDDCDTHQVDKGEISCSLCGRVGTTLNMANPNNVYCAGADKEECATTVVDSALKVPCWLCMRTETKKVRLASGRLACNKDNFDECERLQEELAKLKASKEELKDLAAGMKETPSLNCRLCGVAGKFVSSPFKTPFSTALLSCPQGHPNWRVPKSMVVEKRHCVNCGRTEDDVTLGAGDNNSGDMCVGVDFETCIALQAEKKSS